MFSPKGEGAMNKKIHQLKAFYESSDKVIKASLTAIEQFKDTVESGNLKKEEACNLINKGVDANCLSNFSTLSLTLEGRFLKDQEQAEGMLEDLPRVLQELDRDLTSFHNADNDAKRKEVYQKAIDLVGKINQVCDDSPQTKPTNPSI